MNLIKKEKTERAKLMNYINEPFSYPTKSDIVNVYLKEGRKEAQYLLWNMGLNNGIDVLSIDFEKLLNELYYSWFNGK